jgi:hypothetical protein
MGDLADLATHTAFPGRVRQFAADDPGQALALAVGAAWIEQPRGGCAAAVVPPARRADPLVVAALALAKRLALPNLTLIPAVDPVLPCEPMTARERQPVRLASLGRELRPTWPAGTSALALSACAAREPLLLLPARDPRWGFDRAALLALAWIACDGRRVVWELPAGTPLGAWTAELELIGRMQLPLKLLAEPSDLPWPPAERGLARWWVAMPATQEAAGALAWALVGEETALLAMPARLEAGDAWLPGPARRLREGDAGTMLCAGRLPAHVPPGCGLLQLGSLIPLPHAQLQRTAWPLLAEDEDLARHLASLDPHLRCTLAPPTVPPHSPR